LNRFQLAWTWLGIRSDEGNGTLDTTDLLDAAELFTTEQRPVIDEGVQGDFDTGGDYARLVSLLYKSIAPEVDE
jgi:hypothetical protein